MNLHVDRRLFVVAALVAAAALFATGFFVALGVRSVVAGPGSAPAAQVPPVSHTYDQIELPAATWSGLDADTLDGRNFDEIDDADDHVASANYATSAGSATSASNAAYATSAGSASTANSANTAGYATSAGNASTANSAGYATNAGNADTVDGKHANQIHDADNYVSNADMVDGSHASQLMDDLDCQQWSSTGTTDGGAACIWVSVADGYYLTGGGCSGTGDVARRLIYTNSPWVPNTWICCTTDHTYPSGGTITVYALGCRVD